MTWVLLRHKSVSWHVGQCFRTAHRCGYKCTRDTKNHDCQWHHEPFKKICFHNKINLKMMTYSFLQVFGLTPDIGRYIFNELSVHNLVLHDLGSDVPKVYNTLFFRQSGHITNFLRPTAPSFFSRLYGK